MNLRKTKKYSEVLFSQSVHIFTAHIFWVETTHIIKELNFILLAFVLKFIGAQHRNEIN